MIHLGMGNGERGNLSDVIEDPSNLIQTWVFFVCLTENMVGKQTSHLEQMAWGIHCFYYWIMCLLIFDQSKLFGWSRNQVFGGSLEMCSWQSQLRMFNAALTKLQSILALYRLFETTNRPLLGLYILNNNALPDIMLLFLENILSTNFTLNIFEGNICSSQPIFLLIKPSEIVELRSSLLLLQAMEAARTYALLRRKITSAKRCKKHIESGKQTNNIKQLSEV